MHTACGIAFGPSKSRSEWTRFLSSVRHVSNVMCIKASCNTHSWGRLSLGGSSRVSSGGEGMERSEESAGVSSGVGDWSCICNVEPKAGLWGRGEDGMMSIESLLGPGEDDGNGRVVKSPISSMLAFDSPRWWHAPYHLGR